MSNFKKHKKIYYVPGILSLLVIPLVLWFYGNNYIEENDFRVIKFNMPPKNHYEEFPDFIPQIRFNSSPIIVPPNFSDEKELEYMNLVKYLQEKNIDNTGIKFQLSDDNTYGDMVKLLNLMLITEQDRYGFRFEENTFLVFNMLDVYDENVVLCGGNLGFPEEKHKINYLNSIIEFIQKIPKYSYPILIGYFILVICAIFRPKIFIRL